MCFTAEKYRFASVSICLHGIYDLFSFQAKHDCRGNSINLKFGVLKDAYPISSKLKGLLQAVYIWMQQNEFLVFLSLKETIFSI
jgi:hypothetical protein